MAKKIKIEKEETKKEEIKKVEKEQALWISILELIAIIIFVIVVLVFFPNTPVWNIVVLLLILTTLVFVHEGGHFLIAKACGVHVYEFALGMGPKILGFKRKNDPTEYTLRALPIGGYCAMAGEEGEDDNNLEKNKFLCNKPKLQRVAILVAGVCMNFITAFIILFSIALIWGSTDQSSIIGEVVNDSPAMEVGIVSGDKIVKINGKKVSRWDDVSLISSLKNKNDYFEYVIEHKDGSRDTYKIIPEEYAVVNNKDIKLSDDYTKEDVKKEYKLKKVETRKVIGIKQDGTIKKGFVASIKYAAIKFVSLATMMVKIIGYLICGKLSLNSLSGPVGMYSIVGSVAANGISNILYLAAYLSINLGVINILPFPAFDGGRVVFVGIEAITRKKVDSNVETWFHTIGFILLMALMLYITFMDILKLF